jgi:hypothetical protein
VSQGEADEIIGQITDATVHLVNRNLDMVQRIAGLNAGRSPKDEGPAQEIWTAWTESAGDLVQMTYLTAQLVDTLLGRRGSSSGGS